MHSLTLNLIFSTIIFSYVNSQENAENVGENPESSSAQSATAATAAVGCSEQDQQSCDDVCKSDSFWYGYCASWNGRDLQCSCIGYNQPLDGTICGPEKQEKCAAECKEKGQDAGGYCAVFPSAEDSRGEPKCMCFDKPAL